MESRDGDGAADHDEPYWPGQRLSVTWHQPFTDQQFWRLMVLRSQVRARPLSVDRLPDEGAE